MRCWVVVFCALAFACGSSEPPAETTGSAERFEVPVGNITFHAEVRATAVVAKAGEQVVRAEIRLRREDGSDAGKAAGGGRTEHGWAGVVPGEGLDVTFSGLQSAPGVPAPLNAVVLHLKATVDSENHVDFDLKSDAICIR